MEVSLVKIDSSGLAWRWLTVAVSLVVPSSAIADSVMPSVNVQLRFICLSVADTESGVIEVKPIIDLPLHGDDRSVRIVSDWNTRTSAANSTLTDSFDNSLTVSERIVDREQCRSLPSNVFAFSHNKDGYFSKFCITPSSKTSRPNILVQMEGRENKAGGNMIVDRLEAVASCYDSRGLNAMYNGIRIDREVIRSR